MINGFHVLMFSRDADADRAFLRDVLGWPWVQGRIDDPWELEAQAAPLDFSEVSPRPANIVNVDECPDYPEEIFFVLGGSGFSWQDEQVYDVRAGDCIVHVADHEEHTLHAGPDGLDVLVFGTRHGTEFGWLPRSRRGLLRSGTVRSGKRVSSGPAAGRRLSSRCCPRLRHGPTASASPTKGRCSAST